MKKKIIDNLNLVEKGPSPELAIKVYDFLHYGVIGRKDLHAYADWYMWVEKHIGNVDEVYIKNFFSSKSDNAINVILNSPKSDKYVYIPDPYDKPNEYILRVPLTFVQEMFIWGMDKIK